MCSVKCVPTAVVYDFSGFRGVVRGGRVGGAISALAVCDAGPTVEQKVY